MKMEKGSQDWKISKHYAKDSAAQRRSLLASSLPTTNHGKVLEARVSEAMENATDNGFCFEGWTYLEVAEDLCTYNSDFETETPVSLVPHIKQWAKQADVIYRIWD